MATIRIHICLIILVIFNSCERNREVIKRKELGIYCCASGIGVSMVANRNREIRAVNACIKEHALFARLHEEANVLCLGQKYVDFDFAIEALKIFDVYAKRDMLHRHNSYFLGKYKDIEILGFKSQFTMLYGNNESDYFIKADMGIGINESTKLEGIHKNNFFATYIIGPFLVLNPHFMVELLKIMGVEDPKLAYENEIFEAYNIRLQKFKTMG